MRNVTDRQVERFLDADVQLRLIGFRGIVQMSEREFYPRSPCEEHMHLAERELSSFLAAVREFYGPEQAKLSAEDWLAEAELMDRPTLSQVQNWRDVTIVASARLANRVNTGWHSRSLTISTTNTKVSPIPSSNCLHSKLLL